MDVVFSYFISICDQYTTITRLESDRVISRTTERKETEPLSTCQGDTNRWADAYIHNAEEA